MTRYLFRLSLLTLSLLGPLTCRASEDPSDPVAGRNHWAYRPLSVRVDAPPSDQSQPAAIDRMIGEARTEAGLTAVAPAEPGVLARRISCILTGLPPTPEQYNSWSALIRDGHVESVVDELLESPEFGRHWGRHWLDLARYADSNGLDENFLFREAWRYRNWVISAVGSDMPFDQFLLHQIAGDLLPFDSTEQRDQQRIAAGFLVIGPKVLLGNDPRERVLDVADEQLDTIGRAVLGQTIGCARCHDHKFDPIPTADYYALAGILTSTRVMEQRYMLGQQRVMEQLIGLGEDGSRLDEAYEQYWREGRAKYQKQKQTATEILRLLKEHSEEAAALIAASPEAAAPELNDESTTPEARVAAQQRLIDELTQKIDQPPGIPPRAMVPEESDNPADEAVRYAGKFNDPGETVPRGFLSVLGDGSIRIPAAASGRAELARWLTDTQHGAGHLTARVTANRIWYHVTGRGIVRTVDNFGRTGEPPSHPELLDYLAQQLIDSGWSVRSLIREIVLSDTFRLSSSHDAASDASDPENILLWRAHRRMLSPETLRDSMLRAAGVLDSSDVSSTVDYLGDQATAVGANTNRRRTDFTCRSVYLPVIRNDLPEIFDAFDFADPHACTGARPKTLKASQALFLMNDESVADAARKTAERVIARADSAEDRVHAAWRLILGGSPAEQDAEALIRYAERSESPQDETARWALICQALFASTRFQILE